jgi:hypothetical protein
MTASAAKLPTASMLSVFDERRCIGVILLRGPAKVEAFTAENESLGLFQNEDQAAAALWRHAHHQPIEPTATTGERAVP